MRERIAVQQQQRRAAAAMYGNDLRAGGFDLGAREAIHQHTPLPNRSWPGLNPAIHGLKWSVKKTWIPGTRPGVTELNQSTVAPLSLIALPHFSISSFTNLPR